MPENHVRIIRLAFAVTAMIGAFGIESGALAGLADYHLGPQDTLRIRVYDLRAGTGEAYQWTALNGDFVVGASGNLSLPLVGEIPANMATTASLGDMIVSRLQAKIGLAQRPDASVEVTKYRPFYIMGRVEKPGEYDYRPELTVLQAVSTAGGMSRLADDNVLSFEREALTNRGDLRVLAADRLGLLARQARLDAEIKDVDTISFPPDLQSNGSDRDVERTVREERLLFTARRDALVSQTQALNETKILLQKEVVSLGAKDASLVHQLDVTKKELDQVSGLVAKGLAVLPRQLAVEQSSAQFESNRLDVQLATLRAQQDISRTERDALELRNKRRSDALQEATEVHTRLADVDEKIQTAQNLIYQAEVRAPLEMSATGSNQRVPIYRRTRTVEGQPQTQVVQESEPVQPGDTIRVEYQLGNRMDQKTGPLTGLDIPPPAPHALSQN
ncbi:polysaccharide biosynthesis/export family protein [Lichenihabitans psoromatis]|uniref:polysaccharide biosynthesis/export family protein n=1 Tax=Lichenihabitans psoromatis TaxID=2528642 RepID=UPI0013F14919|nr:polysaccharide biosynthesis/export family protein [Lichenihabitans psoromatis]